MRYLKSPKFPNSITEPFLVTSPYSTSYNCIAWAIGNPNYFYWPDEDHYCYWPENIPREESVDAFIKLFENEGYSVCKNGELQHDYEKIALFVDSELTPTHAAKQLDDGQWSSKLGKSVDVYHSIKSIENGTYGMVKVYLKRKKF